MNQGLDEQAGLAKFIVGQVTAIFFQNPSNFYKVVLVSIKKSNTDYLEKEIVITGSFGELEEHEDYRFEGDFVDHPKYGRQFQVTSYQQEKPTSEKGLVQYLSSAKFPGVGKKTAEAIVKQLGLQAIEIIMKQPERLAEVPGLAKVKQQQIQAAIQENYGMEQIVVGLNQYGFGNQLALTIYQKYQEKTLDIIHENPYQLVEDIEGIGFKRADSIAEQLGYQADAPFRIQAAILYKLMDSCLQSGDTYVPAETLLKEVLFLLENSRPVEISPDVVANEIIALVNEGKIQQTDTQLYDSSLYYAEWGISTTIGRLLSRKKEIHYPKKAVEQAINTIEKKANLIYGESQKNALRAAIQSPLFILTGGPGTGKTTIINAIVQLFAELNELSLDVNEYTNSIFPILLAAPTGRAAKRMNETTQLPASTIHRLLGLTGRERNSDVAPRELEGGLLIVDELSMVDTWLANTLFKAIPTNMQVILVGDKDQLPSVGPGQVLHDLLAVSAIPQCQLTEIYRQGDSSSIIPLAHSVKEGRLPADFKQHQVDRSFIACQTNQIADVIRQVVTKAKLKGFTAQDIQVLAPMYRGVAGIDNLNKIMQEIFNPNPSGKRKEMSWNEHVYRIGDKVLQLVNSPEVNVFNGDMGQIVGINTAKESEDNVDELIIAFDETEVTYRRNEWNKITLAYCCSIHKSQGSEFKMVILPMVHSYQRMLQRNLLYTAITRSSELLILLGEESAFRQAVESRGVERKTTLQKRIQQLDELAPSSGQPLAEFAESHPKTILSESLSATDEEVTTDTTHKPEMARGQADGSSPANYRLNESLIDAQQIDPLIGMDGLTPTDFLASSS